jgi:hypothetical protein
VTGKELKQIDIRVFDLRGFVADVTIFHQFLVTIYHVSAIFFGVILGKKTLNKNWLNWRLSI